MKNRMRLNVENLKSAIKKKRIKKSDLAADIGVTRETLSRWLAGKTAFVEEDRLTRMSQVLECDLSWLSPEAPLMNLSPSPALPAQALLKGDDLVMLSLHSGRWNEIHTLYRYCSRPGIVEEAQANVPLFQILGSLIALDFSLFDQTNYTKDPALRKHELFDIIARYCLVDGILSLAAGDLPVAQRNFKKVMIHGQTEWLLAFSNLMSGISCAILGTAEETRTILERGLDVFGQSKDDLTLFALANSQLILCGLLSVQDTTAARQHLGRARKIFETTGFRHGHVRCEAYDALLLASERETRTAKSTVDSIENQVRLLPRLYQTEILAVCARTSYILGDSQAVRDFMESADECASNFAVFAMLVKKQWLDLDPQNSEVARSRDALKNQLQAHG